MNTVYNFLIILLLFSTVLFNKADAVDESFSKKAHPKLLTHALTSLPSILNDVFDQAEERLVSLEFSPLPKEQKERTISIYQKILAYKTKLSLTENLEENKKTLDEIGILTASHCLLSDTPIEFDVKNKINKVLNIKASPEALYFQNCIFFDTAKQKFSLSQFPAKEGTDLLLYQQLTQAIHYNSITYPSEGLQEIEKLNELIKGIEDIFETHAWHYHDFFLNFNEIIHIYDETKIRLSLIQNRLINFNKKNVIIQNKCLKPISLSTQNYWKACISDMDLLGDEEDDIQIDKRGESNEEEDRSPFIREAQELVIKFNNPQVNSIKFHTQAQIKNFIQTRLAFYQSMKEFLQSNLYIDTEKLLLGFALSDRKHITVSEITTNVNKQFEVYQIAKELFESLSLKKSKNHKDMCTDDLYVLLETHSKSLILENIKEINYINLIINFYSNLVSKAAKDFSACVHVNFYEDYIKAQPQYIDSNLGPKDNVYYVKYDTDDVEPTRSYLKLLKNIDLLSEKNLLKKKDAITEIIEEAKSFLVIYFKYIIQTQMEKVSEEVKKNKDISMFRNIYLSLLGSFKEVSPTLQEYQYTTQKYTEKLEALLKKEPAYIEMKQAEEDEIIVNIMDSCREIKKPKQSKDKPADSKESKKKKNVKEKIIQTNTDTDAKKSALTEVTKQKEKSLILQKNEAIAHTPPSHVSTQTNKKMTSIKNAATSKIEQTPSQNAPLTLSLETKKYI